MDYVFLYPVVMLVGAIIYMIYMKKANNKTKITDLSELRENYQTHQQELLNGNFQKIKQSMKGVHIEAFSSVTV